MSLTSIFNAGHTDNRYRILRCNHFTDVADCTKWTAPSINNDFSSVRKIYPNSTALIALLCTAERSSS